jgi:hypothetical protein
MSPPADAREPGPWFHDRRFLGDRADRSLPAVKPWRRRSRIEPPRAADVLAQIVEHVDQRVSYFAWRREQSRVVPVRPHRAAALERSIHGLGCPDGEPLEATAKTRRTIRFDE